MRKLFTMLMAVVLSLTVFVVPGCGQSQKIDDTKSILNIGVMNAGVGIAWAEEAEKDFEAFYADTVFEEGKKGVEVVIDAKKDEFRANNLLLQMEFYDNALYFVQESDYLGCVNAELIADITDTVKEKVYDANGDLAAATGKPAVKSILDTMDPELKTFYEIDGKYYGIPESTLVSGIFFDADLFNDNGYYFDAGGTIGATQSHIDSGNAGKGPDGVQFTTDDGMPETFEQFQELLRKMKTDGVVPFTWSGSTVYQPKGAYQSVWANFEGYENFNKNFTFSSDEKYDVAEQLGRKAGIEFFYEIAKGGEGGSGYYSPSAKSQDWLAAQFQFIDSINNPTGRIAFLCEGTWWEAESKKPFDDAAVEDSNMGYGKRDFRLFPIPNFSYQPTDNGSTGRGSEILVSSEAMSKSSCSLSFISEKNTCDNPELQKKLAKLFLQFVQSREQLVKYTKNTGATLKPYDFEATEKEKEQWTKLAQNIYSYIEEGSRVSYNICTSEVITGRYPFQNWSFNYKGGHENPATLFINDSDNTLTVDIVYNELIKNIRK